MRGKVRRHYWDKSECQVSKFAEDRDIHRKRGKTVSLSLGSKDALSRV